MVSKRAQQELKKSHILLKSLLLKLNFQDEGHLYVICVFAILFLCFKCLFSQFFSHGMRKCISILTKAQKGHISGLKNGHILRKDGLLKLNFQGEGKLDAYFFIYILTVYRECVLFLLFSCGIRMHIPIPTGFKKDTLEG